MKRLLTIHGPNLNLLGQRETTIYGTATLEDINLEIINYAKTLDYEMTCKQFNHEGEIIDALHNATESGIIINPAAFTHTSVAIRDAISGINTAVIEVHLSNIHAREPFRQQSYTAASCLGQISGFGADSYLLAVQGIVRHLENLG